MSMERGIYHIHARKHSPYIHGGVGAQEVWRTFKNRLL